MSPEVHSFQKGIRRAETVIRKNILTLTNPEQCGIMLRIFERQIVRK